MIRTARTPPLGRWADPLAIVAAALLLHAPVLLYGMPYGHDGATYAAWLDAFWQELGDGVAYPRWLSSMSGGAGSPAFFFYPPLAYYVMAGVGALGMAGADAFERIGAGLFPLFVLSGLGFFWAVRPFMARAGALAGSIVYLILPYHYGVDLWFRADAAEFAGYAWAPICFGFLLRLEGGWRFAAGLAVSFALMILTHLPTALILALGLGIAALWRGWSLRSPWLLVRFAAAMAAGILLGGVYLLPALTMQDITSMHRMWAARFHYSANFLFTSADPNMPPIQNALALATAAVIVPALAVFGVRWRQRPVGPLVLATAGIWFVMSPLSVLLWELLPPLQKVQFPWRFGMLLDLPLAALAGLTAAEVWRRRLRLHAWFCLAGCLCLLFANAPFLLIGHSAQLPFMEPSLAERVRQSVALRRDTAEYRPPMSAERAPPGPPASPVSGVAEIQVERWRSRDIRLRVETRGPAEILVRHYFAPQWEASLADGRQLRVEPATAAGLMKVAVPSGKHVLSLRLAATPAESWGLAASLAGCLSVALMLLQPAFARRVRRLRSQSPQTAQAALGA